MDNFEKLVYGAVIGMLTMVAFVLFLGAVYQLLVWLGSQQLTLFETLIILGAGVGAVVGAIAFRYGTIT